MLIWVLKSNQLILNVYLNIKSYPEVFKKSSSVNICVQNILEMSFIAFLLKVSSQDQYSSCMQDCTLNQNLIEITIWTAAIFKQQGAQYLLKEKCVGLSWPTYHILQTYENIFVWYRSLQKSNHNLICMFINENENNYEKNYHSL